MMKFFYGIVISLLFTSINDVKADILSATLAYNQGEYQTAYQEFQRLSLLGNKDAIYNVGVMFLYGQGVEKNLTHAYAWFLLAADFGLDEARSAARLIEQEFDDPSILTATYQLLQQGFSFADFSKTLLPIFNEKQYSPKTEQPPLRLHSVNAKYPKAAYEKGLEGWVWLEFDVDELGTVKDVDIIDAFPSNTFNRAIYNAVRRWRYQPYQIDGQVKPYSSRSLLYHFTTFKGKRYDASFSRQKRDYHKKINQLIESAEQGNALVQYYIANWLETDEHNATRLLRFHWQNPTASSELLFSSAINGYPNSQYRLGANLLRGEYTDTDRKKGLKWILYAAQSGFVFAQYRLARELLDKRYVEYDPAKAKKWLVTAAKQGHFRAIRDLLALLIETGDYQQAQYYLEQGLNHDAEHPDLLFSQGKLLFQQKAKKMAKTVLLKALKYAKQRHWYSEHISAYLQRHFS